MTKQVIAEYLAEEQKLKLEEPLEGIENHSKVRVMVQTEPASQPWLELRGTLPPEALAEWKRTLDERAE